VDELLRRLRVDQQDKLRVAVLAIDPTRRKGGGALLGDRIRANALDGDRIFFRSMATRGAPELPDRLADVLDVVKAAGFDLVVVETPGIGQGNGAIADVADTALYVMTPEYGAASQLEKLDMLDVADVVAINKFERRGAKDALRDVGRQLVRNREAFGQQPHDMPVFGTSAATFNDDGVTALYQCLRDLLAALGLPVGEGVLEPVDVRHSSGIRPVIPADRVRYLSEITAAVRDYHTKTEHIADAAARAQRLDAVYRELSAAGLDGRAVGSLLDQAQADVPPVIAEQIAGWPAMVASYSAEEQTVVVRDRPTHPRLARESLSGNRIPRVALSRFTDHGSLVRFWRREKPTGLLSFHGRRFPVQAGGRGPGPHVRRRGRPGADQPAVQAARRGRAGDAPVHGVRLGDPVRPRPRPAA
jgi:methylmalonyl-CoA mutase